MNAYTYTITIDPSAGILSENVLQPLCRNAPFKNVSRLNCTGVTSLYGEPNVPIIMFPGDTLTFALNFNTQNLNTCPNTDAYISQVYLNSLIAAMYTNPGSGAVSSASMGQSKDLGSVFYGPTPLGTSMAIYVASNISGTKRVEGLPLSLSETTTVPTLMEVITTDTLIYEMSAKGELLLVTKYLVGEVYETQYYCCSFLADPVVSISPD